MLNRSSLVPFLTCDESQNLHEKMVKNYRNLSLIALRSDLKEVAICFGQSQDQLPNSVLDDSIAFIMAEYKS